MESQKLSADYEAARAIADGGDARKDALKYFFNHPTLKTTVLAYVQRNGGDLKDGEDIFQDALIYFDRALRTGQFEGKSAPATFFIGVAKWRWISSRRKNRRTIPPEAFAGEETDSVEVLAIEHERRELIDTVLSKLGDRCREILGWYKLSYSMEEIAEKMGLSGPEMAKKNAYECRKKFRDYVVARPEYAAALRAGSAFLH